VWLAGHSTLLPVRPATLATLTAETRAAYAGRYDIGNGRLLTITSDGETLRANIPGFREAELIPQSETELAWFNPDLNIKANLLIIRDADGNVTHAAYVRDGRELWRAPRVK
jgi:hypothetical protein